MRKLGTNSPKPRKSKSGSSRSTNYTKPSNISGPDPKGDPWENEVQRRLDSMTSEKRRRRAGLIEAMKNL